MRFSGFSLGLVGVLEFRGSSAGFREAGVRL